MNSTRSTRSFSSVLRTPDSLSFSTAAIQRHGKNFWWFLTGTDRKTQWTEIMPTWNHGMYATLDALKAVVRRIPFPVLSLHHDNGREFVNGAVAEYFGVRKRIPLSRSRFRKKNDNAHVEQKNGSVVRELFGQGWIYWMLSE